MAMLSLRARALHSAHADGEGSGSSDTIHGIGIFLLVIVPLLGGFLTIFMKEQRIFRDFANAFAGGILLGCGLLHFLPDGVEGYEGVSTYPFPYLITGLILLVMYFIGQVVPLLTVLYGSSFISDKSQVEVTGLVSCIAFWFGVWIHGIFEGLAVGQLQQSSSSWAVLIVLFIHKVIEFNALATAISIANVSKIRMWILLVSAEIPCLISFIVAWSLSNETPVIEGTFASLGAGTFLYLSLGHIIPECLDHKSCCNPVADKNIAAHEAIPSSDVASDNTKSLEIEKGTNVDKSVDTKSILIHKLNAMFGVGVGFMAYSLLALQSD